MWYFSEPIDDLDLIDGMYRRRKTTVYAKYLIIYDYRKCEEVEHVGKVVPHVGITIFA